MMRRNKEVMMHCKKTTRWMMVPMAVLILGGVGCSSLSGDASRHQLMDHTRRAPAKNPEITKTLPVASAAQDLSALPGAELTPYDTYHAQQAPKPAASTAAPAPAPSSRAPEPGFADKYFGWATGLFDKKEASAAVISPDTVDALPVVAVENKDTFPSLHDVPKENKARQNYADDRADARQKISLLEQERDQLPLPPAMGARRQPVENTSPTARNRAPEENPDTTIAANAPDTTRRMPLDNPSDADLALLNTPEKLQSPSARPSPEDSQFAAWLKKNTSMEAPAKAPPAPSLSKADSAATAAATRRAPDENVPPLPREDLPSALPLAPMHIAKPVPVPASSSAAVVVVPPAPPVALMDASPPVPAPYIPSYPEVATAPVSMPQPVLKEEGYQPRSRYENRRQRYTSKYGDF